MQGSNEPAERDFVIQNLQAIPCFSPRGHVDQSEENAGDELEYEHRERGAPKNVSPACGLARDRVLHSLPDRRGKLQPLVEPGPDFLDQAHGGLSTEMFVRLGAPGVGRAPALMSNFP